MVTVNFTQNLNRHIQSPTVEVQAGSLRDVLAQVFEVNPKLRSYILDDQSRLRKHILISINDTILKKDSALKHQVGSGDNVYVLQALSGG